MPAMNSAASFDPHCSLRTTGGRISRLDGRRTHQWASILPDRDDVRSGLSKPEKLNASTCFPLCPRKRTSRNVVGMSVSCHYRKSRDYSITSSARRSNEVGTERPSALAVLRFSRLELTLHGSLALSLAADVVVLPLHTRH